MAVYEGLKLCPPMQFLIEGLMCASPLNVCGNVPYSESDRIQLFIIPILFKLKRSGENKYMYIFGKWKAETLIQNQSRSIT